MNDLYEAMKGFSDFPIAVIALILGITVRRKNREDSFLFLLISVSAVIGGLVHTVSMPKAVHDTVWVFLYPMLFEAIRRFSLLLSAYIKGGVVPERKAVYLSEAVLCLGAILFMILRGKYDMLFLIAFSGLALIRVLRHIIANKNFPGKVMLIFSTIPLVLIIQGFSAYIPYAVVIEHAVLFALLFVVYFIVRR